MIDYQLKKRIVNTISEYEKKCEHLEIEISNLRGAINQLCLLPADIHGDVNKELLYLQNELN